MTSLKEEKVLKLSKFFGINEDEMAHIYDNNIHNNASVQEDRKLYESILDDDESSNNSETTIEMGEEIEYNSYYDKRVLYNSWDEFENLRENFRERIPEILKNTDGLKTIFLNADENKLRSKYPMEDELRKSLRDLVKGENEPWVLETTRIIINALRGLDSTINIMSSSNDEINWDEVYIEMAYGIIMNIIIETRENMGECELNRLCYFKCTKCNCKTTYLFDGNIYRDTCVSCWDKHV